jgi:hypothetical protein
MNSQILTILNVPNYNDMLNNEREPSIFGFPYLIHRIELSRLIEQAKSEAVNCKPSENGGVIFIMYDDATSNITRAIQEQCILHTKITVRGKVLNSFWEAWAKNKILQRSIFKSPNPLEEMWAQSKKYNYKLATTFMPSYAKAIYNYFNASVVLDPCAGWGDRLLGALTSSCVKSYTGFDPNKKLRPGYADITSAVTKLPPTQITETSIQFNYNHINISMISTSFEQAIKNIPDNSVDLVFTSPPFYDYEIYSINNPTYTDWLSEFYIPLFIESERVCAVGGHVVLYIDDTSSGKINNFIQNDIKRFCLYLTQKPKIAFVGISSQKQRNIWVFQKSHIPS